MSYEENQPIALALGFFDGVHQGHAALLHAVSAFPNPAALTFDCHPSSALSEEKIPLLSNIEDRCWIFNTYYQIPKVIVTPFSQVQHMPWEDFLEEYLVKSLHVSHIVAGHDFRFGRNGEGTTDKLKNKCDTLGITCEIIPAVSYKNVLVSSTHIRHLIETGEMALANEFLGHPHILSNEVEHGNKIGNKILGFPTVNLSVPDSVLIPAFGVYACRIWVENRVFNAVTNVGIRPTIEEEHKAVSVEGFLLDFAEEELYGKVLRVEFHHLLRNEQKFENLEALSQQIAKDVSATTSFFQALEHNPPPRT